MPNKYSLINGSEIHVELRTESKMFCGCKNDPFGAEKPNIYTCPVCLGLPGALPVPNRKAIEWTIMIGLALNCKISDVSVFDRKHYFYPDLPKGYQISQQDSPLCYEGYVDTSFGKVRINRVHLEEDTAKLIHDKINGKNVSLIDFNRSSVPLVEIVTEPDIKSPEQAVEFLKKIRKIIRYLGVSDADMEKGTMRLEANISLSKDGRLPDYKVEVKNINSFRYYKEAVEYEIKRHTKILDKGEVPVQETRGYDQDSQSTKSQRLKESAQEYGYFPEPDIPIFYVDKKLVQSIKESMPMLDDGYYEYFISKGVADSTAKTLTKSIKIAKYSLLALKNVSEKTEAIEISNIIANKKIDINKVKPQDLINSLAKQKSSQISDTEELNKIIEKIIKEFPNVVEDFKNGKEQAIGFLMGQLMKETKGKADPKVAPKLLRDALR